MAEESKQKFDPDATVAQPVAGPDSGVDPDATVSLPVMEPDPEATFTGPAPKKLDVDATDRRPAFDPDATVNPAERLNLDPDATVRVPSPGRIRRNPFAPKSTPETIQANLAALGGLNALIALANPILGAVPQIRRTLKHPDPAGLRASLRDQIESLQTSASFAEVSDAAMQSATYALCALLDESAAATPWGGAWLENGLLKEVCGESGGGAGFFTRLDGISAAPDPTDADNADLIEFYDVCLALGFEGRYRKAEGGRQALLDVRGGLYALIARRRPRPAELSVRWRSATAEAAAAPALQMAAEVSARISAQQAAAAAAASASSVETTLPPVKQSLLSRIPRRAVWSGLAGIVGVMLVFYMAALRLLDSETKALLAPTIAKSNPAPGSAPAPVSPAARASLTKALEGEPVTVTEEGGRITLAPRHDRQFTPGSIQPAARLRPVLQKIAAALEGVPGAIVVTGHADASPAGTRYASNAELSAARARAVAQLMAPKLSVPGRLSAEGKGDAELIAPGNAPEDRARNRRVTISIRPVP
jgi:type VI secretion system protein ImpK